MLKEIVIVDAGHLNIIFVASITIKSVCGSRRSILESLCPIYIPHPPLHILRNRWVGREPRGNLRRWMHFAFWEDEAISALASDVSCLPIFGDISLGRNLTRQFSFFSRSGRVRYEACAIRLCNLFWERPWGVDEFNFQFRAKTFAPFISRCLPVKYEGPIYTIPYTP